MSIRRAPLLVLIAVLALSSGGYVRAQTKANWLAHYREPAARLVGRGYSERVRLAATSPCSPTLSGTASAGLRNSNARFDGLLEEMKHDGLENVHIEPVMVPKRVRGRERADIIQPGQHALAMLGLGDSVGTPPEGVEAEVLVVQSFAELDAKSAQAKGRIVFFNVPFTNYGDSRLFRMSGPSRAARHGAVAAPSSDRSGRQAFACRTRVCCEYGPTPPKSRLLRWPPRMRICCSAWPAGATG